MSEPLVREPAVASTAPPPRGTARTDAAVILGAHLALGALAAVAWWLLVDPAYYTVGADGALGMGEVQLGRRFGADGWFTVVAGVTGVFAGGGFTWWRSRDPLLTAALLVAGSALATAVMALLGGVLGPADPATAAAGADAGDLVPSALRVTATVCYLVWPIAALAGALMVLWSPASDVEV